MLTILYLHLEMTASGLQLIILHNLIPGNCTFHSSLHLNTAAYSKCVHSFLPCYTPITILVGVMFFLFFVNNLHLVGDNCQEQID